MEALHTSPAARQRIEAAAVKVLDIMTQRRPNLPALREAEHDLDAVLCDLQVIRPEDSTIHIDVDDIHAEGTASDRHTILILTTARGVLIQVNVGTGEVLIVKE